MHHLARTKKDKEVFSPVAELAVVTASPSHNSQAAGLNCGGCEEAAGGKLVRGAAQACAEGHVACVSSFEARSEPSVTRVASGVNVGRQIETCSLTCMHMHMHMHMHMYM